MARQPEVGLAVQALALHAYVPASWPRLQHGRLTWETGVTPASTTDTYRLRLEAVASREAKVFILEPSLSANRGGRLPHVYPDGSLCLNLRGQWRPHMLFTDTVLPWASQWLVYYELWAATGTWSGDGDDNLDEHSQQRLLHHYSGPRGLNFAWLSDRSAQGTNPRRRQWNR